MNIVIDEKIPYLRHALEQMGHCVKELPGSKIAKSDLTDAEALFVRTRTKCDAALLDGTAVRFIGTATIGYDHIDADYCKSHDITWTNAPGCNADAVLQYVQSTIYAWIKERRVDCSDIVLGIVGVGEIGSRIAKWAKECNIRYLLNDPPREADGEKGFCSLDDIAKECNIITFHTTLNKGGKFPSLHLADETFMQKLQKCRLLINASRGAVVDNNALLENLSIGNIEDIALDVWEGEPNLSPELLERAYIATPHIAGYSAEGKLNASRMMLEAFAKFSKHPGAIPPISLPAPSQPVVDAYSKEEALLKIYSPLNDTAKLKAAPHLFEELRNNYELRREPSAYQIIIKNNTQP
jgi:erythronate-4-phosphate dehydrogenase